MLDDAAAFPLAECVTAMSGFPGDNSMQSSTGNWIIGVGAVAACLGLCCLAASLGDNSGSNLLGLGATFFGMGALIAACGVYLNARALRAQGGQPAAKEPAQKSRGGCDLCKLETPVIHCKVHQFHLCANCSAEHYDFRSCVYVPSTRRMSGKPGKSAAAHAR
ncbi:MAG TPA: hypothetical protein VLV49_16385 [Terriglobales bacterium]|nr:hypothetical protein [Terriglobales bacterium]